MKARIAQQGWPFMARIGYLKARDTHGPTLVQDPERALHIRRAFELFATGCHTKTIVLASVTRQGLRTKHGDPVSTQTFC